MTRRAELARRALGRALRLRRDAGIAIASPVCPFDLAEQRGLEVRFVRVPSMEAMYARMEPPTILVSADRPLGRQVFDCAHELGHHEFGHGSTIDTAKLGESANPEASDEEFLANVFASYLLMPKSAVARAFAVRGWRPTDCRGEQFYVVAGYLGVSYEALVTHLRLSLKLVGSNQVQPLLAQSPQSIRHKIVGQATKAHLVVVDNFWTGRAIDLRVNDVVLAPTGVVAADGRMEAIDQLEAGVLMRAASPGVGRLLIPDGSWASFVRVTRAAYAGRAVFRHLEEAQDG